MQAVRSLLVAVVAWLPTGHVLAQAGLEDLLVRMTEATRTSNYQGTVMYRNGEMMETMRLVHRYRDGELRERIFSTSGEPREILRKDDEVTCIIPRERKVTIDKFGGEGLFPALQRGTVEQLRESYELSDLGVTRVAGRQCRGIAIKPRDSYRYGYRLWVDTETNVPVKLSLIGDADEVLEQVVFTNVEFPDRIPDASLVPELDFDGFEYYTHRMMPVEIGGESRWQATGLPPGFRVVRREVRQLRNGGEHVEQLMLSDGLSSVSIYSTTMPEGELFEGPSDMGAVNTYARMIGDYHLTVVGEVPQATVRRIAGGLTFADAP